MDQALGIEKASLSTVVRLNACVLNIYQEALRFTPVFGNLFDLAAQAVACSIEFQMHLLAPLAPHAASHVAAASPFASTSGGQPQPTPDDLAHSMDIAVGERFTAPSRTATSISGGQAERRAKADGLERAMDIAIGIQKAA
jgi:hypothetical protein